MPDFNLKDCAYPRPQSETSGVDQEEYRGCVGRGYDSPDQHCLHPSDAKHEFCDRSGEQRCDQHPHGRQRSGRSQHVPQAGETGAKAAIKQDQCKRDRTDRIGSADIVELDAPWPALTGEHADQQKHQEQGRAESQRDEARQDAGENQQAAKQYGQTDSVEGAHYANLLPL